MKTYRQELQTQNSKGTYIRFLALGIMYISFGLFKILGQNDTTILGSIVWLITGLGFILFSVIGKNKFDKYFIEFNENKIFAKLSYFSSLNIQWNEVTEIRIKPMSVSFLLDSDTKKELSLGLMSYQNVIELKAKLKEFADNKGIGIT